MSDHDRFMSAISQAATPSKAIKPAKTIPIEAPATPAPPATPEVLAPGMVSGADMAKARGMLATHSPDQIAYELKLTLAQCWRLQRTIGLGALTREPDGTAPRPKPPATDFTRRAADGALLVPQESSAPPMSLFCVAAERRPL